MSRYTAAEVIQLPRLQASGAMALGGQLLSAAKPHKKALPKSVAKALGALDGAHGKLADAIRDQVSPASPGGEDVVKLDRHVDGCWSGLNDYLTAFTKLPELPETADAASLKELIFGKDGLKFILLDYELEWAESDTRLARMRKHGLDARIEALGGGLFLKTLVKAHDAYGKALGMGAPLTAPESAPPSLREALGAFAAALRTYVVKVMGSVEDDEPDTQALADKLLLPLATWDVGPAPKASKAQPSPAAPADKPAPAIENG
jgi:hypothetical protein